MLDILADVHEGTKRDARLFSASANGTHGMRLSNADKRRSVLVLLLDKEWAQWSNNQIAKHCHVTHTMVNKIRNELEPKRVETVSPPASKPNKDAVAVSELPKKEAAQQAANEEPEYTETDHHIDQLEGAVETLREENDRLANIAASKVFEGSEEDRAWLLDRMNALTEENARIRLELGAVTASRDTYMRENAQLKTQLRMQRKQLGMAA
jgi:hypothetical protein